MESESTPADRNQLQVWPRALETVRGGSFGMSGRKAVYVDGGRVVERWAVDLEIDGGIFEAVGNLFRLIGRVIKHLQCHDSKAI